MRGIGAAGLIALIVGPAVALAGKPGAGRWGAPGDATDASGSLVVTSNRKEVKSLTVNVESQDYHTGAHNCPTGSVTVSEAVEIKKWTIQGTQPFWAFGKLGFLPNSHHRSRRFEEASVRATLDGQPRHNVAIKIDFGRADQKGLAFVTLDLDANHIKPAYGTSLCTPDVDSFQPTHAKR
jgi:hypothetical protein